MTASIKVKIAVVPPIPRARVSIAAEVKPGARRNCRSAYRALPGRPFMFSSRLYSPIGRRLRFFAQKFTRSSGVAYSKSGFKVCCDQTRRELPHLRHIVQDYERSNRIRSSGLIEPGLNLVASV